LADDDLKRHFCSGIGSKLRQTLENPELVELSLELGMSIEAAVHGFDPDRIQHCHQEGATAPSANPGFGGLVDQLLWLLLDCAGSRLIRG